MRTILTYLVAMIACAAIGQFLCHTKYAGRFAYRAKQLSGDPLDEPWRNWLGIGGGLLTGLGVAHLMLSDGRRRS